MNIVKHSLKKLADLGRIDQPQTGMSEPLILPQGDIELKNGWPSGELSHGLPGPLRVPVPQTDRAAS